MKTVMMMRTARIPVMVVMRTIKGMTMKHCGSLGSHCRWADQTEHDLPASAPLGQITMKTVKTMRIAMIMVVMRMVMWMVTMKLCRSLDNH